MERKLSQAAAYVDPKDAKRRWAWRVTFWEGQEESGAMPDDVYDPGEALEALIAIVRLHGGDWALGASEHVPHAGGYWLWRSNESLARAAAWRARTDHVVLGTMGCQTELPRCSLCETEVLKCQHTAIILEKSDVK